jgi:hypothetical protein
MPFWHTKIVISCVKWMKFSLNYSIFACIQLLITENTEISSDYFIICVFRGWKIQIVKLENSHFFIKFLTFFPYSLAAIPCR